MKPAPYYTQSGLARLAGVTRYAVNVAIRRGQIAVVPTADGDGQLVPKAAGDRWLKGRSTPPAKPQPPAKRPRA